MRRPWVKLSPVLVFFAFAGYVPAAAPTSLSTATGPAFRSIGALTFGTEGTMFAADAQAATVFALDLGAQAAGGVAGTGEVTHLQQKIAAMLGDEAWDIAITDLKVHPRTHNTFVSVMRGQGPSARPALIRVDGVGHLSLVDTSAVHYSSVALPNPPATTPDGRGDRAQSITQLAVAGGRVLVAGLSNEEFSSKLWSVGYPFTRADSGTSVEFYHGYENRLETRAPIYAFVPYTSNNVAYVLASYTCTPLISFRLSDLKPGEKLRARTIGEFGADNRPLDMILYKKDGQDFVLMANTSRGLMKMAAADVMGAPAITAAVKTETAGVHVETITSVRDVTQLDLLDASHSVVIAGGDLKTLALP
jgi:hypothetical protein